MAAVKVLARGWTVEVDTIATPGTYIEVLGLSSLTFDGAKNDADTTTFDDQGWETHLVASRNRTVTLEGMFLEDPADGTRDLGQEEVEKVAELIGQTSLHSFRLTSPGGTVRTFDASANVSGIGGGNNDPTGWSAELKVSGQITVS